MTRRSVSIRPQHLERVRAVPVAFVALIGVEPLIASANAGELSAKPDKIVVVIEENHSYSQVIGSIEAPYINLLASEGALFTNIHALTHPSQPNYLQFFSGSNQGVLDNTAPAPGSPFTTPNLGAAVFGAGRSFTGYCEDLPEEGSTVTAHLNYVRKHNPWVNWQGLGVNQVPPSVNQPFAAFPSDYSQLPDLAIVVPNQQNNMHDGTISMADQWILKHIIPYAEWAMTHNSLLIITWDEDESASRNRIPTIFFGPMVRAGVVDSTYTLHNLQRTLAELRGAGGSGSAAITPAIVGAFSGDSPVEIRRFRQGISGYAGATDTSIEAAAPTATHASDAVLVADGSPLSQCLIRFDGIFGAGADQVPRWTEIVSAKLVMLTGAGSSDDSDSPMSAHRMLIDWSAGATWSSLAAGVSADGVEAAAAPEFTVLPNIRDAWAIFDVTATVQSWASGTEPNRGWAILAGGTDGWRWPSSESLVPGDRPFLEIVYRVPPCPGDADGDAAVDLADLGVVILNWFGTGPAGDLDGDGAVGLSDAAVVISAWGAMCP